MRVLLLFSKLFDNAAAGLHRWLLLKSWYGFVHDEETETQQYETLGSAVDAKTIDCHHERLEIIKCGARATLLRTETPYSNSNISSGK